MSKRFDLGSIIIIVVTFALFALALITKGLSHDILLESGVFLVSVKLIMMSGRLLETTKLLEGKLDAIETSLRRTQDDEPDKANT